MVPLFGDMQIAPFQTYIKKSPHYDASKWPLSSNTSTSSSQSDILQYLPSIRDDYVAFISELSRHSNEVTTTIKEAPRSDAENKQLLQLALKGRVKRIKSREIHLQKHLFSLRSSVASRLDYSRNRIILVEADAPN